MAEQNQPISNASGFITRAVYTWVFGLAAFVLIYLAQGSFSFKDSDYIQLGEDQFVDANALNMGRIAAYEMLNYDELAVGYFLFFSAPVAVLLGASIVSILPVPLRMASAMLAGAVIGYACYQFAVDFLGRPDWGLGVMSAIILGSGMTAWAWQSYGFNRGVAGRVGDGVLLLVTCSFVGGGAWLAHQFLL